MSTDPNRERVEALAEALCFCGDVHDCQTTQDSDRLKAACDRNVARVRDLLAEAWDEGVRACEERHGSTRQLANPYRQETA